MTGKKRPDSDALTEDLESLAETPEAPKPEPVVEAKPEETPAKPDPNQPVPAHLADRAAALHELTEKLEREILEFKSGQSYIDGDVPVYLDALGGSGVGPTDRRVGFLAPQHLDSRYAYRWANKQMVDYHRAKGRQTISKTEFDLMVRARGGSYSYGANSEGHLICGDLVLMYTTQEQNEALKKRVRDKTSRGEGRARGNLRQLGKQLGMEVTGETDVGPKIQRIMNTIASELGPDALKVFQGSTR